MLQVFNKANTKVGALVHYNDLCITKLLAMDDKTLSFTATQNEIKENGVELEGYLETKDDRFVIREMEYGSDGKVKVTAQLDVETLEGNAFTKFRSTTRTVETVLQVAFAGTGWTVGSINMENPDKQRTISLDNCTSYQVLKQVSSTYRIDFLVHSKTKTIDIYDANTIGEDKGTYFSDELNLTDLSVSSESHDYYTELEAYGKNGLTFADINDGKVFVTNYSYSSKSKRFIWKDERYTVAEHLLEDSIAKLEDMAKPYVSYTATVVDLARVSPEKYSVLDFHIGDIVYIIDQATKTKEKQRIVEIQEYPDEPNRNTCTLANMLPTFEELTQKYDMAASTVDNITSSNGTVSEDAIEAVDASKIVNLENAIVQSAKILSLETNVLNVTQELTAANARIGELAANVGEFETLAADRFSALQADIGKLRTEELSAAIADINTLSSNYANIKTVLTGNVGAGDLTTIQLNAQNAVIDNAFLRSLIASNITVNDLLAGRISTTKFTVGSDSGNFKIEDNTLQIKDSENHVRVQIGEDAGGNYSIVVYDATGSGQLFNQNGITESGITDGLIKDAKIASDANIQATKLDIASLFTVLNDDGSGQTIKSSKIYLDDQGQSLSVAFTQMSSTVSDASSTATKASADAATATAAAQEAMKIISGIDSLNALGMTLTNDAHVVHTNTDGTGGDYSYCYTEPMVFLGELNVTAMSVFETFPSTGLTGTWNNASKRYQVTALSTDNGHVDFRAVYGSGERYLCSKSGKKFITRSGKRLLIMSGGTEIWKRFSVSKAPDGKVGLSYVLQSSVVAITRSIDTSQPVAFEPSTVIFRARQNKDGVLTNLSCRFQIEETENFANYVVRVPYGNAMTSYTYTPTKNAALRGIRCTVKDATEDVVLDSQEVVVLADADGIVAEVEDAKEDIIEMSTHMSELDDSIDGFSKSISDINDTFRASYANDLAYDFTWSSTKTTTTLSAHVYAVDPDSKRRTEITDQYPDHFFSWTRRSETDTDSNGVYLDVDLGTGKTLTVQNSDFGLDGNIDGWFYPFYSAYLTTRSGKRLTTRSGKRFIAYVF